MAKRKSKAPLTIKIEGNELVVRIGVDTLAFAVAAGDYFQDGNLKVTDAARFANDVVYELVREEEDGSNMLHALFDKAAEMACENGSEFVEDTP